MTFFILLHVVLNWFTRYFAFINQGIGNLLEEESEIRLPPEMAATERKLNAVKGELKRRAREAKMAEQRKNDLVMYLAHDTGQICEHHAGEGLPAGENGG